MFRIILRKRWVIYLVEKIISGIANVLDQNYPDAAIYAQEVKQHMREPCFFIQCLEVGTSKRLAHRYDQIRPFEIVYFPKKKEDTREIQRVLGELPFLLEFIQLADGPVMGSKMESKIDDDLGHFLGNFDFPIRRQVDEGPNMEEIEIMGGIKFEK